MNWGVRELGSSIVDFALENQDGTAIRLENEEDRKFLVMGMALHGKGRKSLINVGPSFPNQTS